MDEPTRVSTRMTAGVTPATRREGRRPRPDRRAMRRRGRHARRPSRGFALAALMLTVAAGFALGGGEPAADTPNERGVPLGEPIEITGRVRRVGSDPFSSLVITDTQSRDWRVLEEWEPIVADFEQREVTVRAIVSRREMELADGTLLPPRWELSEVELLASP